jgi:hypothetical protein
LPHFDVSILRIRRKLPQIHHIIKTGHQNFPTIKQNLFSKYGNINTGLLKFCTKGAISEKKLIKIKLAVKTVARIGDQTFPEISTSYFIFKKLIVL